MAVAHYSGDRFFYAVSLPRSRILIVTLTR